MVNMYAKDYQDRVLAILGRSLRESDKEWSISKKATDIFAYDKKCYTPRIDVVVGPFNRGGIVEQNIEDIWKASNNPIIRGIIGRGTVSKNPNPRCLLAIEIVFSGSSKHILGDIANASMMGLYGIVVAKEEMLEKVKRIYKYTRKLQEVGKAPKRLFNNVVILGSNKFIRIIKEGKSQGYNI